MKQTIKAILMLFAIAVLATACGKDNENQNTEDVIEQTHDYDIFPDFKTLESYIGRDTASIIAEFQGKGYEIRLIDIGLISAIKDIDSERRELYHIGFSKSKKINFVSYAYYNHFDDHPGDLKESFIYMFNDALNTFCDRHQWSFYGCYFINDEQFSYYTPDSFLSILQTLPDEQYRNYVATDISYGHENSNNRDIDIEITDDHGGFISYVYKDRTIK